MKTFDPILNLPTPTCPEKDIRRDARCEKEYLKQQTNELKQTMVHTANIQPKNIVQSLIKMLISIHPPMQ